MIFPAKLKKLVRHVSSREASDVDTSSSILATSFTMALLNRKQRLVPSPRWPLAIGSIVVWAPGSGYNPVHGHIEIVTRIKPPQACSDGCGAFRRDTMEGLAARAAAAAERVQELGRQIAQLQASGISDSRRKRQLAQLRGRQAAAVKASEPLVKVYVIER